MPIEKHRLNSREQVIITIEVSPSSLDKTYLFIREVVDRLSQDISIRHEICIKNEHVVPLRGLQSVLKGSSLVSGPVLPVDEFSIKAISLKLEDLSLGDRGCFVGRVVQKLNLKFLLGVIQLCHRSEQALHDVHLVEDR